MIIPDDLYRQIVSTMPIACVDLVVRDRAGAVLLVRRRNEPAADEWWFPGGRIHFGERRRDAAARKLAEEVGLAASDVRELGTYDVLLPLAGDPPLSHGVSTLFEVRVDDAPAVRLDPQSDDARWAAPEAWLREPLAPFVAEGIRAACGLEAQTWR
ncbi:MAG TPA: NUDIX hydrolase [Gemmatimonadaceae bacterium]|nr:NUDIX hydrolase [Gemmatimonadaceae bacterium]